MAECQRLKPVLVGQYEFLEWLGENHLRHSKLIGLREDKAAKNVSRECRPSPARLSARDHSKRSVLVETGG
jgi:ATP-dependent DNA ligase